MNKLQDDMKRMQIEYAQRDYIPTPSSLQLATNPSIPSLMSPHKSPRMQMPSKYFRSK